MLGRYKIVAAYDTETTNICSVSEKSAFPVLHQIGEYNGELLKDISPENVESLVNISMYRHTKDAINKFNYLIAKHYDADYIPVVMVHNLAFDMYALHELFTMYNVDVLAKSSAKPITFTVKHGDTPVLVFWDTLSFFAKSLNDMGSECGVKKMVGDWDYNLIRTPETPLTPEEIKYAENDIYTLFAYIGYYMRLNNILDENKLSAQIATKTGAVRYKRRELFYDLKSGKKSVGVKWVINSKNQLPKTADELEVMHAATRGGFTFTASKHASKSYELGYVKSVCGFDAASQHPAQMVSHCYPENFRKVSTKVFNESLQLVKLTAIDKVLVNWHEPFGVAFYGQVTVKNVRLRASSRFEKDGIATLASQRVADKPYKDNGINIKKVYGKIVSADELTFYTTELEWWIFNQVYDYNSFEGIWGYATTNFRRPTEFSLLSVMYFYKSKNIFKKFMNTKEITEEVVELVPKFIIDKVKAGDDCNDLLKRYYQILKADLNALYGIEITNEARPEQMFDLIEGIVNLEGKGLDDLPNTPKTWYQFGQRIVGWSRVAQIVNILLIDDLVDDVINGDTDSLKVLCDEYKLDEISERLRIYGDAVTDAKNKICAGIKSEFPEYYDSLDNIGLYELEFKTKNYFSAWNKAYCIFNNRFDFTIAGVPTNRGNMSYNKLANTLYKNGWSFSEICNLLLGYNITIDHDITLLNERKAPRWGQRYIGEITDYNGETAYVDEIAMIALYNDSVTLRSTLISDNLINSKIAKENNPNVNTRPCLICWQNDELPEVIYL